jgi:peptidoglycan biosynthesis protein MviN/MurJ (putative lipid II flippase)
MATIIAFIEIVSYLFCGLLLSKYYSYKGLAIAQSFSTGLTILFSLIIINRRLFKIDLSFIKIFSKIIFSNLVLLVFFSLLNVLWIDINSVYAITLKTFAGLALLYYLLLTLKVQEVLQIKYIINLKINNIINHINN